MGMDAPRYGIEDLANLGGVSRRTVRYYVQEGLLPAPLGVGRGRHYGPRHLERLLEVKAMQEAGRSLDEIRRAGPGPRSKPDNVTVDAARSLWRRLVLAPGVELHVATDVTLPSPTKLQELTGWCRTHFRGREDDPDNG
jgi:DNA-binding transcriptional MerR regulator